MSGKIKPKLNTKNKEYDNREENPRKWSQSMGREDRERKRDLRREKSEVGVAALEAKGLSLYICWFRFSLPKFLHFFIAPKILTFCRPHVEALCLVLLFCFSSLFFQFFQNLT